MALGCRCFGSLVQHVHRFVHPAALGAGVAIPLGQGLPEAEGSIADGEPGINRQAAALQVQPHRLPGFLGFTESVGERQELLLALGRGTDDDEDARVGLFQAHAEVDAVDPQIHVLRAPLPRSRRSQRAWSCCQAALSRLIVPADSPGALWPNSAVSASPNSPVEIPLRYSHGRSSSRVLVRRRYGGRIEEVNRISPARSRTRGAFTGTAPMPVWIERGGRWPVRTMRWRPAFVARLTMPRQTLRHFAFNGLGQQLVGPLAQDVGARSLDLAGNPWISESYFRIVMHAAYALLAKGG